MSKNTTASMTFICEGTLITGEMSVEHDLRVEGSVKGAVSVGGALVLGPTGRVEGDITARSATLAGHISGNVHASEKLVLESKSVLVGDLQTRELVIQEGAIFQGKSAMDVSARPA